MYYIDLNYLMEREEFDGTLEEAMSKADEQIGYTQQDARIYDDNDDLVAIRHWNEVPYEEGEEEDCIPFGSFGFYSPWEKLDYLDILAIRRGRGEI